MAVERAVRSGVLATELATRLSALQRILRRQTRAALGGPTLSFAEVDLLRLVVAQPGIRVGEAAAALRLAPNTTSTVSRQLIQLGLLAAEHPATDRRRVHLRATTAGKRGLQRWRDERTHLLADALEQLSAAERRTLESSLPVLSELTELLGDGESA